MTTRHEFLSQLHDQLKPRGYLEIGVQYGTSLALAKCPAIGVDPAPMLQGHFPGTTMVKTRTSDEFFEDFNPLLDGEETDTQVPLSWLPALDLAFIDGMHLFEYALRDFENIEKYANPRTVVVFDDVLPRNQHEAAREQCPGDWTGDVWKVPRMIQNFRNLEVSLVDTFPTGTAVVYGFGHEHPDKVNISANLKGLGLEGWETVPEDVINRMEAVSAFDALEQIVTYLSTLED